MSAKTQRKAKSKVKRHTAKRSRAINRFCIVGAEAVNRTWLDSEKLAVAHAEPMFRKNIDPNANPQRLLIVKVVRVIERTPPKPAPLTLRLPRDYDFIPKNRATDGCDNTPRPATGRTPFDPPVRSCQ